MDLILWHRIAQWAFLTSVLVLVPLALDWLSQRRWHK